MSQHEPHQWTDGGQSPPISAIPPYPAITPQISPSPDKSRPLLSPTSPTSQLSVDSQQALLSPAPFPSPTHLNFLHPYPSPHDHTRFSFNPYQPHPHAQTPPPQAPPGPASAPASAPPSGPATPHSPHPPYSPHAHGVPAGPYYYSSRVPGYVEQFPYPQEHPPPMLVRRRSRSRSHSPVRAQPGKGLRRVAGLILLVVTIFAVIMLGVYAWAVWGGEPMVTAVIKAPSQALEPVTPPATHDTQRPDAKSAAEVAAERQKEEWRRVESFHELLHERGSHDNHPPLKAPPDTHEHSRVGVEVPAAVEYVDALGHAHPSLDPEVERAAGLFDSEETREAEGVAYLARGGEAIITQRQLERQHAHGHRAMVVPSNNPPEHILRVGFDHLGVPWQGSAEDLEARGPGADEGLRMVGSGVFSGKIAEKISGTPIRYSVGAVPWQGPCGDDLRDAVAGSRRPLMKAQGLSGESKWWAPRDRAAEEALFKQVPWQGEAVMSVEDKENKQRSGRLAIPASGMKSPSSVSRTLHARQDRETPATKTPPITPSSDTPKAECDEHGHMRAWVRGRDVVLLPCRHGHVHEWSPEDHSGVTEPELAVKAPSVQHRDVLPVAPVRIVEHRGNGKKDVQAATRPVRSSPWPNPRAEEHHERDAITHKNEVLTQTSPGEIHVPAHDTVASKPPPEVQPVNTIPLP